MIQVLLPTNSLASTALLNNDYSSSDEKKLVNSAIIDSVKFCAMVITTLKMGFSLQIDETQISYIKD